MTTPTRQDATEKLHAHVQNDYQRHHALMVATAMEGYAKKYGEDENLWYITGLLHDVDYEQHPEEHPGPSLTWFKEWGYPDELMHAVEAHALGFNGFTTEPQTLLAKALMACDEISGIFYAYKLMNPIPYGDMKVKSIKKRLKDKTFAAKISRDDVMQGAARLDIELDEHIENLISFFASLD